MTWLYSQLHHPDTGQRGLHAVPLVLFGNTVGFQWRSAFPGTAGVAGRGSALLARLWPPFLQQSDGQVSGNTQTLGQHLVVWTLGGAHSPIELLRISEMHLTPVFLIHFREDSKLPRKTCFGHNFTLTSLLHALVQQYFVGKWRGNPK